MTLKKLSFSEICLFTNFKAKNINNKPKINKTTPKKFKTLGLKLISSNTNIAV